jgi:hypothetical protein
MVAIPSFRCSPVGTMKTRLSSKLSSACHSWSYFVVA